MHIKISINGTTSLDRRLRGIEQAPQDMRPAWNACADLFEDHISAQFASEGGAARTKWAPLSRDYKAQKDRLYPGAGILYRSGRLEQSLTMQPFGIDVREPRYAIFGTAIPYGRFHQEGRGRLPQRKIIVLTPSFRASLIAAMKAHVLADLGKGKR